MPLTTSVVLCTCNGARFLEAQWDSLLAQSRLPDEIVVRDDASSDATGTLLDTLRKRTEGRGVQVRLRRNSTNLGYVANFEAVLQEASGDLLFLCDQDDVWHREKLATLAAQFETRPDLLLLCGDARRIDATGAVLPQSLFRVLKVSHSELRRIHAGRGFEVLLRRSLATGATVALRRSLLADALPFPSGWVHDEWLAIIAAALGGFDCVERSLVDYRQHESNQIGMPDRDLAAQWRDLLKPRAALIDGLIARDEALQARLHALDTRLPAACRRRVAEKLSHLRARGAMRGAPWTRLARILRETTNGNYRRYGTGLRSGLRDLLRRVET
ncbi:MAG TPA: glycosyltransferase family 2 protein [Rhodanobacteraceae bacterium]|nr:glycosyltransferase family 2 protein [Rhodanobacteraceae bacterium]